MMLIFSMDSSSNLNHLLRCDFILPNYIYCLPACPGQIISLIALLARSYTLDTPLTPLYYWQAGFCWSPAKSKARAVMVFALCTHRSPIPIMTHLTRLYISAPPVVKFEMCCRACHCSSSSWFRVVQKNISHISNSFITEGVHQHSFPPAKLWIEMPKTSEHD